MLSEQSKAALQMMRENRSEYVDYLHTDFAAATKMNSAAIDSMSDLAGLEISRIDADGVPAERILVPGADPDKYIYYIHGGGWTNGEPAWGHFCAVEIARKCRRNILLPDYRLAPEHRYPAAHEDCYTAYRWMLRQGIPAKNIVFLGESTGGTLVLTTAVKARLRGAALPAAICSVSPVADLSFPYPSYESRKERDCILPFNQKDVVRELYICGADTRDPEMSPIFADFTGFPPVYFEVSSEEMLFDDTIRLYERMTEQGVAAGLKVWEGMWHTFYMNDFPESRESFNNISAFFLESAG